MSPRSGKETLNALMELGILLLLETREAHQQALLHVKKVRFSTLNTDLTSKMRGPVQHPQPQTTASKAWNCMCSRLHKVSPRCLHLIIVSLFMEKFMQM